MTLGAAAPTQSSAEATRPDFDVVTCRSVSRHYGRRRALSKVSLTMRAGEIVGLFGPNGAGKSTLLMVLATLLRPTDGEVTYGTSDHIDRLALRSRIGLVGHDAFLYGDLSARENLRFFGGLYGVSNLEACVEEALIHARLSDRANDRVSSFSRGLKQRLAVERALLHEPRLVLLDEPFTGLDDQSATMLAERLRLLRTRGAIVVMATHDFDSAEPLVDASVGLTDGRARLIDAGPGSLRDRYRRMLEAPAS